MTDDEYKGLNDMIITMKDQDGLPFNYVIQKETYMLNPSFGPKSLMFRPLEDDIDFPGASIGETHWIIGVTFMQNYLTIYDSENIRIGIIEADRDKEILDKDTLTEYAILILSILLIISGCCGGCCCGFRPCRKYYSKYKEEKTDSKFRFNQKKFSFAIS